MKVKIPGGEIRVDKSDLGIIRKFHWRIVSGGRGGRKVVSARILLHRVLIETDLEVDHKNGDTLDNRRKNLREATHQENSRNRKLSKRNKSGHTGVFLCSSGKYKASIRVKGKIKVLGHFTSKRKAVACRRTAEKKYYGEFVRQTGESNGNEERQKTD